MSRRRPESSTEFINYTHDPSSESHGLEAAEKLGVPGDRALKTLVEWIPG